MERMSVFLCAENEAGHVQAVIRKSDVDVFQALGFVKSVNDVKHVEKKAKPKRNDIEKAADDAGNANEG